MVEIDNDLKNLYFTAIENALERAVKGMCPPIHIVTLNDGQYEIGYGFPNNQKVSNLINLALSDDREIENLYCQLCL